MRGIPLVSFNVSWVLPFAIARSMPFKCCNYAMEAGVYGQKNGQ